MEYQKALDELDPNSTDNFSISLAERSAKTAVLENQQDIKVCSKLCYNFYKQIKIKGQKFLFGYQGTIEIIKNQFSIKILEFTCLNCFMIQIIGSTF